MPMDDCVASIGNNFRDSGDRPRTLYKTIRGTAVAKGGTSECFPAVTVYRTKKMYGMNRRFGRGRFEAPLATSFRKKPYCKYNAVPQPSNVVATGWFKSCFSKKRFIFKLLAEGLDWNWGLPSGGNVVQLHL